MDDSSTAAKLRDNIGKRLQVTFGGHTETLLIVSVDLDGFICIEQAKHETDKAAEFWIAYSEVTAITEL